MLGKLDRKPPPRPLHQHGKTGDGNEHRQQADHCLGRDQASIAELQRAGDHRRHLRDDAGQEHKCKAVADAPPSDLLAEPHRDHDACGQREHSREDE